MDTGGDDNTAENNSDGFHEMVQIQLIFSQYM